VQGRLVERVAEGEEQVVGVVDHVFYSNEETGWCALRVELPASRRTIRAAGVMPGIGIGDPVELAGEWTTDKKWGAQLKVARYEIRVPTTDEGIRKYLGSGMVPGIGAGMAGRLVDHFGADTLDVIDTAPQRLAEVEGIGPKRAQSIKEAFSAQRDLREVMVFLQGHGVSAGRAAKIYKRYGDETVRQVQQNPYRLADDVFGIGFVLADRVAGRLGVEQRSPFRIQAGLVYELGKATEEGHLYLPGSELVSRAASRLEVDQLLVEEQLPDLVQTRQVVRQEVGPEVSKSLPLFGADDTDPLAGPAYYKPALHFQERTLAQRLRCLIETPAHLAEVNWARRRGWVEERLGLALAPDQARAVECAVVKKVAVITGGPGTGKTTIIRGILEVLEKEGLRIELAAPTGRAAKRMQEATGRPARTVHRMLEFVPSAGGFQRTAERPLETDLVVIDEVSMLDVPLACALVRALDDETRLVLVGDSDQLPSVGPGAVLAETIASGVVPTVRLTEVFRQAARSQIVMCAHQVNQGHAIEPPPSTGEGELFVVQTDDSTRAAEIIERLVVERIPRRYGLDPVDDVQVLSPTKRGVTGTVQLNAHLQRVLNPGGSELTRGDHVLRFGDKVMQIKNDYDKEVFNGDVGRVVGVDTDARSLKISFDGRVVPYGREDLDKLMLAYACTVHKSQGSEYPAVVLPLLGEHYMMLQRNLLYTAVTRARQLLVLVASPRALRRALGNDLVRLRHTALARRLRGDL
jgi:exodeoxyribonuclease V alpha subunit